jgi:hypothetical protein
VNVPVRRARTLEEYRAVSAAYFSQEALDRGLAFKPRPSDVFIATYAKAGTTWMQQIVHGLRTKGSMDFGEITEVVPWIEVALILDIDPEAEQVANPRAFKTHLSWDDVPKGGRYIVIFRDPKAVGVSLYRFMSGWFFEPGSISQETYLREFFLKRGREENCWQNMLSWWQARDRDDVLTLIYEDMTDNLPQVVRRVARFIGLDAGEETLAVATRQARFDFMKAYAHHFDDHLLRDKRDVAAGLPPGGESNKVATGTSGKEPLSDELIAEFDDVWREIIASQTGLADYAAFRASVAEASRRHG